MRYVFWGTPEFAAAVLKELVACGIKPAAVVANPDRPRGRHKLLEPPAVKKLALELPGVPVFQPEKPAEISEDLINLQPDFFIVAAYGRIIPGEILRLAKHGAIGVHPSLLPKYRGPSPIQSAILRGESETGVSLYRLTEKMDDGPVYAETKMGILAEDDAASLSARLAEAGGKLLCSLLAEFPDSLSRPLPQEEAAATYTKKFETADAFVPPQKLAAALGDDPAAARDVFNAVRAFHPEPGAWTLSDGKNITAPEGKRVKLLRARLDGNKLRLSEVQEEGGKPRQI